MLPWPGSRLAFREDTRRLWLGATRILAMGEAGHCKTCSAETDDCSPGSAVCQSSFRTCLRPRALESPLSVVALVPTVPPKGYFADAPTRDGYEEWWERDRPTSRPSVWFPPPPPLRLDFDGGELLVQPLQRP